MSIHSVLQRPVSALHGTYSVICLALVVILALLLLCFPLKLESRRTITRFAARSWFALSGVSLKIYGTEFLQTYPAVAVANHASYIDGILLHAVLPVHFGFVIKREVTKTPFLHFLLRRIGAHFVERNNRYRSGKDAKNILNNTASGGSVAIFPEGTFTATSGLAPFRTGAFAAAVAGQAPVIPVVITGTRTFFPANAWLPTPGPLEVRVLAPISCPGEGRPAMRKLARLSRQAILQHLDEPDLQPATERVAL